MSSYINLPVFKANELHCCFISTRIGPNSPAKELFKDCLLYRIIPQQSLHNNLNNDVFFSLFQQAMEVGGVPLIPDEGDKHNIVAGCQASDLCNTVNCPPNSRCIDLWDAHECRCDQG